MICKTHLNPKNQPIPLSWLKVDYNGKEYTVSENTARFYAMFAAAVAKADEHSKNLFFN